SSESKDEGSEVPDVKTATSGAKELQDPYLASKGIGCAMPNVVVGHSDSGNFDPLPTFRRTVETKAEAHSTFLNKKKLKGFLHYYGAYPDEYRLLIWRFLLQLPENRDSYEALLDQGTHPAFLDFRKKFPLRSERLAKSMERVLSALAYWSPVFEHLDYLPSLIFPFVKLAENDMFSGFEIVMTVLINWCQKWWDYFPNAPIEALDVLEDLLAYHDSELLNHFMQHKVTSQIYGWLPMQTLLSELFSKPDWLRVWDHLVSNPPSFMYILLVAYIKSFRVALLDVSKTDEFKRRTPISVAHLLEAAYKLGTVTPVTVSPATFFSPFAPVLKGQYPVFDRFPEFVVDYQRKMKERMRRDEEDYVRK
ncbi:hypothetical protein BDK51DRAFT_30230, partial [Blyttiomyces helicus]